MMPWYVQKGKPEVVYVAVWIDSVTGYPHTVGALTWEAAAKAAGESEFYHGGEVEVLTFEKAAS